MHYHLCGSYYCGEKRSYDSMKSELKTSRERCMYSLSKIQRCVDTRRCAIRHVMHIVFSHVHPQHWTKNINQQLNGYNKIAIMDTSRVEK